MKLEPIGFLTIRDGNIRMLNIAPPASGTVDRIVEMIPDLFDRIQEFIDKNKEKQEDTF